MNEISSEESLGWKKRVLVSDFGKPNIQGQLEDTEITKETQKTQDDNNGCECNENVIVIFTIGWKFLVGGKKASLTLINFLDFEKINT